MKCLLVSDLHYTLKQFDWLCSVTSDFDLVVVAGDHLDISSLVAVDAQIVVILKYFKRLSEKTRLIVSSGNHDLNARNGAGERICKWLAKARQFGALVDHDSLQIIDTLITICPWWDGPQSRHEVGEKLAQDAARHKTSWIWVYHAPPDQSPVSWGGQKHFGDCDLSHWIDQYNPDVVLTGHIHQSPFRDGGSWVDKIGRTWVFNAGRQIGPCPTHVVLDLNDRTAKWFSLAGNQVVELDAAAPQPVEISPQ
jgi:Icc-related predicted phosphoesterase